MTLYITEFCLFAVVHRPVNNRTPGLEVVEVVPMKGEEHWICKGTFYMDKLPDALGYADDLEAASLRGQ